MVYKSLGNNNICVMLSGWDSWGNTILTDLAHYIKIIIPIDAHFKYEQYSSIFTCIGSKLTKIFKKILYIVENPSKYWLWKYIWWGPGPGPAKLAEGWLGPARGQSKIHWTGPWLVSPAAGGEKNGTHYISGSESIFDCICGTLWFIYDLYSWIIQQIL